MECAGRVNSTVVEPFHHRIIAHLHGIMEALTDDNINVIGVYGYKKDSIFARLLQTVSRRAKRDDLFPVVKMVTLIERPSLRIIQEEIAEQLGFCFHGEEVNTTCCFSAKHDENIVAERARQLCDRIMREPKILVMFLDLDAALDLAKLGIPCGDCHRGCKVILTSQSEEILSNHMRTQKNFNLSDSFE